MPYYLPFDGSNDYVTLSNLVGGDFGDRVDVGQGWVLEWKFKRSGSDSYVHRFFDNSNGSEEILYRASDGLLRVSFLSGAFDYTGVSSNTTDITTFRLVKTAGVNQYELLVDIGNAGFVSYGTKSTVVQIFRFDVVGRNGSIGYINGDLYYVDYQTSNSGAPFRLEKQTLNGSNATVFPDTEGGNDGTLNNFPSNPFVFYSSGGATLSPQGIVSDETFGSPSIVLGSVTLGATAISSEEVFGSPSLLAGASSVQPSSIPTGEALGSPNIGVGGVLIEPVSIVSEELFGTPDVVSGLTAITPEGISSAEAFGTGLVQNLLVIIEPLGIPAESLFGNPLVLGGDRIVIPIANRATWNKIASYLRTLSFTGSDNDVIIAWLRSEGLAGGQYNDLWVDYFESVGFTGGSLTDNQALWKKGENG